MTMRRRRDTDQVPLTEQECYCGRLDLPHRHTLGECDTTPRPGRKP